MLTSITDIQTYKRCRRRWNYQSSSRMNLTKIGMGKPALELGSLVHAALADWTINPNGTEIDAGNGQVHPSTLEDMFLAHSEARVNTIKRQYRENIGTKMSDEELTPMYESIDLGRHMMINYQQRWGTPLPSQFKFALPEQDIIVEIPGTEHYCEACLDNKERHAIYTDTWCPPQPNCDQCHGTGTIRHKLRAILDGLIQDERNGAYFCLERKTFSPKYRPDITSLRRTDQFVGYLWVMRAFGIQKIGGLAYDGMSKQKAPSKTGKYTRLQDLFIRTPIQYSVDEIDAWGENLAKTVNEMASITEADIYPNIPWNGCDDCGFINPCDAENRREDIDTIIRLQYVERPSRTPILAAVGES